MKWPKVKLDSIKADVRYAFVGGPFGSNLATRDYVDEGVPIIRGNNLPVDRTFLEDDFVFVTEEKADKLQSNTAYPGDVIFIQRGTLGQVGIIPLEAMFSRQVISQSRMKLSVNPEKADARFNYYFFRMPSTVQSVINHALTSGVPHINLSILKDFEIPLPHIAVQVHIADILSAYDDLIENNRRRMALLEETVRQLYREWFVRLRFPGHEHTRITHGVPEGWEFRPIGEVATLNYGKALKTEWFQLKQDNIYYDFRELGKYVSALANEANLKDQRCSWLVFGVRDNDRAVVGSRFRENPVDLNHLKQEIAAQTTGGLTFLDIHIVQHQEGRVVLFQIPPTPPGVPTAWQGHWYGRDGESLGPLALHELEAIRAQSQTADWAAAICRAATLDDLDPDAVAVARANFQAKNQDKAFARDMDSWSTETFLDRAKLTSAGRVTRTALLLLGRAQAAHHLQPAIA